MLGFGLSILSVAAGVAFVSGNRPLALKLAATWFFLVLGVFTFHVM